MNKMENELFTVGIVIADKDEYVHIDKYIGENATLFETQGLIGHTADIDANGHKVRVRTVCSGIGKVNASIAATLIADGCDLLISAGLSGGFGETKKYDIVLGTEFFEHDFDLTAIGYKIAQKPGDNEPLISARELNNDISKKFPFVKKGVFVTGDSFISSKEKHDFLKKNFDPIACDMESAAVAMVAQRFDIPFVSVRMVSDGADDDSAATYTDTLGCDVADRWVKLTFDWIKSL